MAGSEKTSGAKGAKDSGRWLLKYGDRVYGPYTDEAMRSYIAEGRIVAQSLIAPEGTTLDAETWQSAATIADFANLFGINRAADLAHPADDLVEAGRTELHKPAETKAQSGGARPTYGPGKGQIDRRRQAETANFIVIMDIKARFAGPLEQAIMSLGPAYKLAPNVWCVNTNSTAAGLLNDLSIHIGKTDSMFIVDATRDRTAWHNLGPETDAKIRRVWRRAF
ncbi:MAG: hypothetical protein K8R18_16840 [Parvibaculum sp.]|uniref:hypothetical protein n=1 Tax=Parvibaculum sp. TaxID=2024848 RepID=UPI00260119EB|nr:hypothetical protein [Parvibaculum sp.]MCE9651289.1 hypothetical protein [Parvibaculum sp.]